MYFVYIIRCADDTLYTGITTDLERRFSEHKNGKGGNYTRAKRVSKMVFSERHPDRSTALKREAEIKKWKKGAKLKLVNDFIAR